LAGFWSAFSSWKHRAVTHAHGIGFSFLPLLAGLAMPYIRLVSRLKWIFGTILMVGVVISPVFEWFKITPGMIADNILIISYGSGILYRCFKDALGKGRLKRGKIYGCKKKILMMVGDFVEDCEAWTCKFPELLGAKVET